VVGELVPTPKAPFTYNVVPLNVKLASPFTVLEVPVAVIT
jgi:hypothetical protein